MDSTPQPPVKTSIEDVENLLIVGWDGSQRDRIQSLLDQGRLPTLASLIKNGSYVEIDTAEAGSAEENLRKTETKPGWAQIFTGYSSDEIGVKSNKIYQPIPKGLTLFERVKALGDTVSYKTYFLSGKINNIGARGPHTICMNCVHRWSTTKRKTFWWTDDGALKAPLIRGQKKKVFENRTGEPFHNALSSLDRYSVGLGSAPNVLHRALNILEVNQRQRFVAFFHFEEPDEIGHRFGESSERYLRSIERNDYYLAVLINKLHQLNLATKTAIIVASDHGMDANKDHHYYAPETFLAANISHLKKKGDRADLAPTFFELLRIPTKSFQSHLRGNSLLTKESSIVTDSKRIKKFKLGYFHGGRTAAIYRAQLFGFMSVEGVDVDFYSKNLNDSNYFVMPKSHEELVKTKFTGKVTGDELLEQLIKGKVDAATIGETSFVKAVEKGLPIVAIAELGFDSRSNPGHAVGISSKLFKSGPPSLNKVKWASRRSSGGDDIFLDEYLLSNNLEPKKMDIKYGLSETEIIQGISDGTVTGSYFHLHQLKKLVLSGKVKIHQTLDWLNPEYSQALLVVRKKDIKEKKELLVKFLSGYLRRNNFELKLGKQSRLYVDPDFSYNKGLNIDLDFKGLNYPQFRRTPFVRTDLLTEWMQLMYKHKLIQKAVNLSHSVDRSLMDAARSKLMRSRGNKR